MNLKTTPIDRAKGLSSKNILECKRLGIKTIADALLFFPTNKGFKTISTYVSGHHFTHKQDLQFKNGKDLSADIYRTSKVMIQQCRNGSYRLSFHSVPAEDKSTLTTDKQLYHDKRGFWINMFVTNGQKGKQYELMNDNKFFKVSGPWDEKWNNITISGKDKYHDAQGTLIPYHGTMITAIGRYTQKTGVPEKDIQYIMMRIVPIYSQYACEVVPESIRHKHHLFDRGDAIFSCHFPGGKESYAKALKSEKFEELYAYAVKLAKLHQQRSRQSGFAIPIDKLALNTFKSNLPYQLTRDQTDSVKDILYDLHSPYKMARLLQGDVGSGKTVTCAFAILAVIKAGYQAAIMIPTTVLGEQHYGTFTKMFKGLDVRIGLLTGKTSYKHKKELLKKLKEGKIDLIIGTEALYQKKTKYKKLGLVVIDEQHRFGVNQRKQLANKTKGCNVLSMTATPIPRTLATAIYHAMDVSQIRTMPKGRRPVRTAWVRPKKANPSFIYQAIYSAVKAGGQIFVIAKLVKPSKNKKMKGISNAKDTCKLIRSLFKSTPIQVALVTGQMDDDEKNKVLTAFSKGEYQVLVATSVVEVGVDIKNANLMIILDSDRYGLAQLHQLRGRVGRNSKQAYCLLIGDPKTPTGVKRMKAMETTTDGFVLSQIDLKLRGGGNVFGQAQHGLPDFPLADLSNSDDVTLLQLAEQDAERTFR